MKRIKVVMVLAGGLNEDGDLSRVTKDRLDAGIEYFNNIKADYLLVSGGARNKDGETEAGLMKRYAIKMGVPEERVITEHTSRNTIGNFAYSDGLLSAVVYEAGGDPRNIKIRVVTSDWHVERAQYIGDNLIGGKYEVKYVGVRHRHMSEEELERREKLEKGVRFPDDAIAALDKRVRELIERAVKAAKAYGKKTVRKDAL